MPHQRAKHVPDLPKQLEYRNMPQSNSPATPALGMAVESPSPRYNETVVLFPRVHHPHAYTEPPDRRVYPRGRLPPSVPPLRPCCGCRGRPRCRPSPCPPPSPRHASREHPDCHVSEPPARCPLSDSEDFRPNFCRSGTLVSTAQWSPSPRSFCSLCDQVLGSLVCCRGSPLLSVPTAPRGP
ncbi:unnamed protein product [Ectocarpus fasciculatus]